MTEEINEQEMMTNVALKTKERVLTEIPRLQNLVTLARKDHARAITPLTGMMRSFSIFCNSEDNEKLLHLVSELYASYAYNKQNKDSLEKRSCKTILGTLKKIKDDIDTQKRKGMGYDFHFDFYPFLFRYSLLLIKGHRQRNDEEDICKEMMKLVGDIAERELKQRYIALETAEKLLH